MDSIHTYYDKLTSSAREALAETTEEIKNKILFRAMEIAQLRETGEKEISLRDIIEAKEQLLEVRNKKEKLEYRSKRMSLLISLAGATYALAGILIYTFQSNKFNLKDDLGLLVSGIGILTMLIGFIYSQLLYKQKLTASSESQKSLTSDIKTDYGLVERWQIIEKLASDIMIEKGISENKSRSINMIIEFLSLELGDLTMTNKLRKLLIIRNKILHEFYQPNKSEKTELINFSNVIIEKLEQLRKVN